MAGKRGKSSGKKSTRDSGQRSNSGGKVGSDPAADREFGGKNDFGIPAAKVKAPLPDGGREKGPEPGTGSMRSVGEGRRDTGVGYPPGPPGVGSGGDLDPDYIGLDGKGGLAATPASGRTTGPDVTEGGSSSFASGGPAAGENELPAGIHGASPDVIHGSTVNRSGGDATTTGDDPAAGELSSDETSGQQ
jgi:hypothetical protein